MPSAVIRPLSPLTIQKIAAGEVIERPVNAVKELVENSLDAGATRIAVTLADGGKELIRVADNGSGMTREDVLRCWLPHTTSKIAAIEDLESAASFGFRGEALASMAAVSEMTVETRHWEEEMGTRLRVAESRAEAPEDMARAQGTTITLANLFRNNPVRRKFLAGGKGEGGRIASMLSRLSLAHPGVSFKLSEGTREILHLPEGTLRRRAGDVLGTHVLGELLEVDWEGGGIHVQGYISEPQRFSGRPGQQHFFINRRLIHSGLLSRALAQAYEAAPPGRHPVAALFLTLAPAEIDVNVHPAKREIRFLQEGRVFWALSQALRSALRRAVAAPELDLSGPVSTAPEDAGAESPFRFEPGEATASNAEAPSSAIPFGPALEGVAQPARPEAGTLPISAEAAAPCLQIHGSFLLVAVRSGYLLINQRAAHERILYERALDAMRSAKAGRFSAQQLLFPELLELTAAETRAVEERQESLRSLGFDLEPFGATAFQIRGLPAEVAPEKAAAVLRDLVAGLMELPRAGEKTGREMLEEKIAAAYARSAAIPLGEPLDAPRMAALVDGLFATRNPYVTPGGQPVLIRHALEDIRRRLGIAGNSEG